MANNNIIGRMTCPICGEPSQDLKVNINHKLYMFCDNGCTVKLNSAKSKRYLPVLLSGSDVKDDVFGLILSTAKGKTQNEIKGQKEIRTIRSNAANDNTSSSTGSTGSSTGSTGSTGSSTGSTGNNTFGRSNGSNTGSGDHGRSGESIIGRAVSWLTDDDDE